MYYKLLALDLDGTCLQDDHQINPYIKKLVHRLKFDYQVMIVTGRHHTAAKPYYDQLQLDTPIICCNGTYIYDFEHDNVLYENAINRDLAIQFIRSSQQHKLKMVMYIKDAMTYSSIDPIPYMLPLHAWANTFSSDQRPTIYQTDDFESLTHHTDYVWKFVIEGEKADLERFLQQGWIEESFEGAWSGESRIDLAAKGNNKGQALANYAKRIGIAADSIVAAGDNFNDVTMLSYAGVGIAMAHAHPEVKKSANLICGTDNYGDGLARIVETVFSGNPMGKD